MPRGAAEDEVRHEETKGEATPDDEKRKKIKTHREDQEAGVGVRALLRSGSFALWFIRSRLIGSTEVCDVVYTDRHSAERDKNRRVKAR